jgi:hypothetical protein
LPTSEQPLKRISLLIREDQYTRVGELGLNLSGLVRDLIDDHLSEHKVTISVGEETRRLYETIVSNTGSSDADIEVHFREALGAMLKEKIKSMQALEASAFGGKSAGAKKPGP